MKPKTMGWAGGRVILAVAQLTQRNRHGRSPSHHGGAKSWSSIDPWLGRFLWYPHDLGNSMDIGMLPCSFLGIHGCMFNFYGICAPPLPTSDSSCLTHLWQRHLETCSCQSNPRVDKKPSGYSGLSMTFPLTCPFGDFPSGPHRNWCLPSSQDGRCKEGFLEGHGSGYGTNTPWVSLMSTLW